MSLSTTMPNLDTAYTQPIYNNPKPKQLRASLSRRTASPRGEPEDQQSLLKQWHKLMQKIQSERQEISALQEESDQKQATVDKNSLTPELKKLIDQVQDLKDDKRDLDDGLARIRQKYTPEAKADIDNEVFNLRKDLFFDTEALETIKDNIKKMKDKSKNFENEEPAKSIIEAEKRITELTHKLDDLYRESAQIDVDFEETFNPSDNGEKKENRKVRYLKRKLQLAEDEVEKKTQEIQQIKKDHEKAKEQIMLRADEEERKKKFRAELSKSRRREMIAQQCKAAGIDVESEENKKEENKSKTEDDMDLEKMLGLNYDILDSSKHHGKRKKASKKKKAAQKADSTKVNTADDTKTNVAETKKTTKKSKKNIENTNNANNEDNIFRNDEDSKNITKKNSTQIDEEKDLVKIGQSDSDSGVQIIEDNDVGELANKINDALLKNEENKNDNEGTSNGDNDIKNEGENDEDKDEMPGDNTNEEGNIEDDHKQNEDNTEYYYIDCVFNQVTLLDVSPESFSKSPAGNFSSMLSSGLGLLNNDKDSKKLQYGQIKVAKHNKDEQNELTLWNSQDVEDEEADQSSVNILPLYDIEYNQDWKIVSKTLKSKTQPVSSIRKSKDNQSENDESNEAKGIEEDKIENADQEKTAKTSGTDKKENQIQKSENDEKIDNEEGKNLSSVLDETNSLFDKTDKTTEENEASNNESKEKTEKQIKTEEGEEKTETDGKSITQKENEENKSENAEKNKENENESVEKNIENDNENAENKEKEEGQNDEESKKDEDEEVKKPTDVEENLDILNGVCGTSPNRGDVQENAQKKTFEITVLVDGFLRENRSSESEKFDSMVLLDISPSPLFAKLSDVFKKKGIISAGKFNYDI